MTRSKWLVVALAMAGSWALDLFVLRAAWTGHRVADGQYRRGYFEPLEVGVGLAIDAFIRPVFPSTSVTADRRLAVPPGMAVALPLVAGQSYEFESALELAPYVVLGVEAPLPESDHPHRHRGEARLMSGRTLSLRAERLELVPWQADRPWRDDERRLAALRERCADADTTAKLSLDVRPDRMELHLGRCTLQHPLPESEGVAVAAAISGPEWLEIGRSPGWRLERWYIWPLLPAVALRVVTMWWVFGAVAVAGVSAVLVAASQIDPMTAVMTWPIALLIGVVSAVLRAGWLAVRMLSLRLRWPVAASIAVVLAAAAASGVVGFVRTPRSLPPIMRIDDDESRASPCAVIGYSTAGGASLRGAHLQHGRRGLRWFLDDACGPCRGQTAARFAGGQTLDWARDAYCDSPTTFGGGGAVIFFGAANDDFLWATAPIARLLIADERGAEAWRRSQAPAAAASLARIGAQEAAIAALSACVRSRGARLIFLHDFLVSDMLGGRDADRAEMLARRRAAVEAVDGVFVDLEEVFASEVGVAWFNDYVHPSLVGHERIAAHTCELLD